MMQRYLPFLFKVEGYSMFPTLSPGSILFVSPYFSLKSQDIVVVNVGNKYIVKFVEKIEQDLIFLKDHTPFSSPWSPCIQASVLGKVIFHWDILI